jgi:Na+/H+ antiporter NhaA
MCIANLAFGTASPLLDTAKLGILVASSVSGAGGYLLRRRYLPPTAAQPGASRH